MRNVLSNVFNDSGDNLRFKVAGLYAVLLAVNLAAWAWALIAFQYHAVMLGTALLAYSFGLRHAVDADHIAAIDNVTRKLMQEGKRPAAVGFFFSLGHSTIVVFASTALAATATFFQSEIDAFHNIVGVVGTLVSVLFLLAIAAMNIVILLTVCRTFRLAKAGAPFRNDALDTLLAGGAERVNDFEIGFGLV
jgi:nickel/cobalt transporter (NiCoT) family protein